MWKYKTIEAIPRREYTNFVFQMFKGVFETSIKRNIELKSHTAYKFTYKKYFHLAEMVFNCSRFPQIRKHSIGIWI